MNALAVLKIPPAEVRVFKNIEDLSCAAAHVFVQLANEAVRDHGRFAVALSGGSTPKRLYSLLAEPDFCKSVQWDRVHLFWGDERCVPPDHPESNYGMLRDSLLRKISAPVDNIHRIRGEVRPEQAASEYETLLRDFFELDGNRLPRFDLVLLGLGENGHTASLFPHSPALDERKHLAVEAYITELQAYRVTLTLPVLNQAANTEFLVAGRAKQTIVRRVFENGGARGALPAQRVRPVEGTLLWFVDEDAAAGLLPALSRSA